MKTDALGFTKQRLPTGHSQSCIKGNKYGLVWQDFFLLKELENKVKYLLINKISTFKQSLTVRCTAKRTCKQFLHVRVVKDSLTTEPLQGRQP